MRAFVTGSRVFGTPREDGLGKSDVDLKIYIPTDAKNEIEALKECADHFDSGNHIGMHFGEMHLHIITNPIEYWAWYIATQKLIQRRPVTNREATDEIDNMRLLMGDNPFTSSQEIIKQST